MVFHHCILLFLLNAGFLYTDHIVVNKIIIRWDVLFNGIMEGFIWHLRLWCILCICSNCLDALLFLIFEETNFWEMSHFWTHFALVSTGWASEALFVSIITTSSAIIWFELLFVFVIFIVIFIIVIPLWMTLFVGLWRLLLLVELWMFALVRLLVLLFTDSCVLMS